MKKYILPIIAGFVMGIIGFFVGHQIGSNSSDNEQYNSNDTIETNFGPLGIKSNENSDVVKNLSYEQLKQALLKKEKENILEYLEISGHIETRKEGSMFNKEYIKYFSGYISNNAILLLVKDISVKVEFYSYTDALIGSETVVIYDFVDSQSYTRFTEKITVPDDCASIKYKILKARSAEKDHQAEDALNKMFDGLDKVIDGM